MGAKPKTIKNVIRNQIDDWCKSIDDRVLVKAIKRDAIVTGGSIVSMFLGERINDFDIYFKSYETTLAVAKYYANDFKTGYGGKYLPPEVKENVIINLKNESEKVIEIFVKSVGVDGIESERTVNDGYDLDGNGKEIEETIQEILSYNLKEETEEQIRYKEKKYHVSFLSPNAITLSDRIQIITRFYGDAEQIHKNFDFVHAMCWYDYDTHKLHTPQNSLYCILSKTLKYEGSLYPIASLFRMKKFIERGWKCSAGEIVKIAFQISNIDMNSIETLRQQLTGVDMLYLRELVDALESYKENNVESCYIDHSYVVEIVDRIFAL
jgi:hypothetical protein